MIKIVIDTNIIFSSFYGGNPRKIIDLWKTGEITLCISSAILREYLGVLQRLDIGHHAQIEEFVELFSTRRHLIFCSKTPSLPIVKQDPDDDKFIEAAVALQARFIVTGDKALLKIASYHGIDIVSPRQFLETFQVG